MGGILKILSGIGVLIAIYLFLSNGNQTVKIINSFSEALSTNTQVLQGRRDFMK